ncbi:MAG: terminase gpA endonuclease subunit [Limnohabitans sp.]
MITGNLQQKSTIIPPWVPTIHHQALADMPLFTLPRLPEAIRRRLRQPEKIRVSDHAEKYRIVTDGAHVGPWRHEYAPHTVKIMDSFGKPYVREVWFCGVEQSGKTNTMLNCMAWCIDCDPGTIFYLMPTEATADKIVGEKIKPVLHQSPRLARYLTGRADDVTLSRISLNHGVTVFPAYANSPSSMASFTAKHCFGDEVDKYPAMAGKEADPITLIKKRNRTYRGRYKRFFASTPAQMFIYKGTMACPQVWQWRVSCLHCNELIEMDGDHLILPDDANPETLEASGSVSYACNNCGTVWSDDDRQQAIRRGRWVCIKGDDLTRPTRIGYHHRAWECLDVPLLEIAIAFLKAKNGSMADKVAWANGYDAVDYEHIQKDRDEDHILRLVDAELPKEIVPRNTSCLLLHVDTQRVGFFYQVWAYGYGRDLDATVIDHGKVNSFANLIDLAAKTYADADGKNFRALAAFIDSGGGTNPNNPKHSRTTEVYEFCRRNPTFKPLKGRRTMEQPWDVKRLDYYPGAKGQKIAIPGGIMLYKINVTIYKNELAGKLQAEPDNPGSIRLHRDIGKDFATQLCAEYQDDHGWWICPRNKDNHHWDIGVYALAGADIVGVRNFRKPGESPQARRILSKGVPQNG